MNDTQPAGWLSLDVGRLRTWFSPSVALGVLAAAIVYAGSDFSATRAHVLGALAAAWLAASAASLLAQALRQPLAAGVALQLGCAAIAGAGVWFDDAVALSAPLLYPALALACLAAPLPRLRDADAYWAWCEKTALAAILTGVAAGAGALALVATFWSADQLFGIGEWLRKRYAADTFATFFLAIGPAAFLALLPSPETTRLEAGARDFVRRAAMILASWALTPFVLIYSALLWAYAGKIAIEGALPDGRIGWMVGLFGLTALATVLCIYPQRASGPARVRLLWRIWPYLAIAPLGLLAFALWTRVDAYGLTPARYVAILLALLCATIAVVAMVKRDSVVRVAPAVAAIALLVASFGPWGARGASSAWQAASMRAILAAHDLMRDGEILLGAPSARLSEKESGRWTAARAYLSSQHELRRLTPDRDGLAGQRLDGLVRLVGKSTTRRHVHFTQPTEWSAPPELARYALVAAISITASDKKPKTVGAATVIVSASALSIVLEGRAPAVFEFDRMAAEIQGPARPPGATLLRPTSGYEGVALLPETITLTAEPGGALQPGWIRAQIVALRSE